MERDVPVTQGKEDIAMDTAAWDADYVATKIATTLPKRGECAGDTEQRLRNAVRKDAYSMRQKEGFVRCIPDQNAARKDVSAMPRKTLEGFAGSIGKSQRERRLRIV